MSVSKGVGFSCPVVSIIHGYISYKKLKHANSSNSGTDCVLKLPNMKSISTVQVEL